MTQTDSMSDFMSDDGDLIGPRESFKRATVIVQEDQGALNITSIDFIGNRDTEDTELAKFEELLLHAMKIPELTLKRCLGCSYCCCRCLNHKGRSSKGIRG